MKISIVLFSLVIIGCRPSSIENQSSIKEARAASNTDAHAVYSTKAQDQVKEKAEYTQAIAEYTDRCFAIDSMDPNFSSTQLKLAKFICIEGKGFGLGWKYLGKGVHSIGTEGGFVAKNSPADMTIFHVWFASKWDFKKTSNSKYEITSSTIERAADGTFKGYKVLGKARLTIIPKNQPLVRKLTSDQLTYAKNFLNECRKIENKNDYRFLKQGYKSVFDAANFMCFVWLGNKLSVEFRQQKSSSPLLSFDDASLRIDGSYQYDSVRINVRKATSDGILVLKTNSVSRGSDSSGKWRGESYKLRFADVSNAYVLFDTEKVTCSKSAPGC